MFAESIHSVADTVNQIILAFGLHRSAKVNRFVLLSYLFSFIYSFTLFFCTENKNTSLLITNTFYFFKFLLLIKRLQIKSIHMATPI